MKKINELTQEELKALIENNYDLGNMVYDDMIETEMVYISDQLNAIRSSLKDWNIGPASYCYIRVHDALQFLDGLEKLQKTYGTLPDDQQPEIDRVLAARDRFRVVDMSYRNLDRLSDWLSEKAQYFADRIADYFRDCLDPSHNDMVSYFLEFYAEERMDSSYWIRADGKLFQTITREVK